MRVDGHLKEITHEGLPLREGDAQVLVSHVHGRPAVALGAASEEAHQLGNPELEAAPLRAGMPADDLGIRVEDGIRHPLVHAAVHKAGDTEDAPTALVQGAQLGGTHRTKVSKPILLCLALLLSSCYHLLA